MLLHKDLRQSDVFANMSTFRGRLVLCGSHWDVFTLPWNLHRAPTRVPVFFLRASLPSGRETIPPGSLQPNFTRICRQKHLENLLNAQVVV